MPAVILTAGKLPSAFAARHSAASARRRPATCFPAPAFESGAQLLKKSEAPGGWIYSRGGCRGGAEVTIYSPRRRAAAGWPVRLATDHDMMGRRRCERLVQCIFSRGRRRADGSPYAPSTTQLRCAVPLPRRRGRKERRGEEKGGREVHLFAAWTRGGWVPFPPLRGAGDDNGVYGSGGRYRWIYVPGAGGCALTSENERHDSRPVEHPAG